MIPKPQKLVIDIGTKIRQSVWSVQSEMGCREVDIEIVQNGRPYDITDYAINVYCKTPKDDTLYKRVQIINGERGMAKMLIPQQVSSQFGVTKCCLSFIKLNQLMLSFDFNIDIDRSVFNEESLLGDDFSALVDALSDVKDLEDRYVPRLGALERDKADKTTTDSLKNNIVSINSQLGDIESDKANKTDVINSLDSKRDKTTTIKMIDLDQDVKAAITGGSVAVVGPNAVDTLNVVDGAITDRKVKSPSKLIYILKGYMDIIPSTRTVKWFGEGFGVVSNGISNYSPITDHTLQWGDFNGVICIYFNAITKTFVASVDWGITLTKDYYFICMYYDGKVTSHMPLDKIYLNGVPCGTINTNLLADKSVTLTKLADGVIPSFNIEMPMLRTWGNEYLNGYYKKIFNKENIYVRTGGDSITLGYGLVGVNGSQYTRDKLIKKMILKSGIDTSKVTTSNGGHGNRTYKDWIGARVGDLGDGQHIVPVNGYLGEDMALNPNLYIVAYGINDMNVGTVTDLETNLREGLARIRGNVSVNGRPAYNKSADDLQIILCVPFSSGQSARNNVNWVNKIRPIIQKACRDFKCAYCDFSFNMYDVEYSTSWSLDGDSLHPTEPLALANTSILKELVLPYGLELLQL